jgi:hypothetical protein
MRTSPTSLHNEDLRFARRFGPVWPPLPWEGNGGRYRFPMRGENCEEMAVRIEALWSLFGVTDAHRRLLLLVARNLQRVSRCFDGTDEGLSQVVAQVDNLEREYLASDVM